MGDDELPAPSDEQLLAGSRHDPSQFGVFYDRHAAAVLAFCVRRTGSVETALDLTAEVFAAAYAKRTSFRRTGAPARAWLYGIARRQIGTFHRRNRVADRYRRRFGIPPVAVGDDWTGSTRSQTCTPSARRSTVHLQPCPKASNEQSSFESSTNCPMARSRAGSGAARAQHAFGCPGR